jgi:hypothetical protein
LEDLKPEGFGGTEPGVAGLGLLVLVFLFLVLVLQFHPRSAAAFLQLALDLEQLVPQRVVLLPQQFLVCAVNK